MPVEPDDIWINLDCSPVVDEEDRVVGGLAILVETSERVRAEESLRQSNERLRIAQRAGMIGTFEWYPDSGRLDVSDEYRAVWGLPADVTVTDDLLVSLVSAEDRLLTGPARLDERNPLDYAEYRITRADNHEQRWIARRGEVMAGNESGDRRFVGVAFDVTERRRVELALKESEERFRAIANSAPVLMWVRGLDGRQEFVNSAYCAFLGLPYPQAVVVDWLDALHPEDRDRIREELARSEPSGCAVHARGALPSRGRAMAVAALGDPAPVRARRRGPRLHRRRIGHHGRAGGTERPSAVQRDSRGPGRAAHARA